MLGSKTCPRSGHPRGLGERREVYLGEQSHLHPRIALVTQKVNVINRYQVEDSKTCAASGETDDMRGGGH
jgi:hypothetical protein